MINVKSILKALRILKETDQSQSFDVGISDTTATNTKVVLQSNNTNESTTQVLTLPDGGNSTIVDVSTAQTLESKSIDSQENTITVAPFGVDDLTDIDEVLQDIQDQIDTKGDADDYLRLDGTTPMQGNLDMGDNSLINIPSITHDLAIEMEANGTFLEVAEDIILDPVNIVEVRSNITMESNKITNQATPTDDTDVANKEYVDDGLAEKAEVIHTHTADQVSFDNAGTNISATDVHDALVNLDSRIDDSVSSSTFVFNNNQTSPADVTGLFVDSGQHKGFSIDAVVERHSPGIPDIEIDTEFISATEYLGNQFDGEILASAIDSSGNTYLVGSFQTVNSVPTGRVVKLTSSGEVDSTFRTNIGTGANGTINCIAIDVSNNIYLGGVFTSFNGNSKNRMVRLSSSGVYDATFNGNLGTGFGNTVNAISINSAGTIIYVGGLFTTFNGNTRNRIAVVGGSGVEISANNTNLGTGFNGSVNSIINTGTITYIGGAFTDFNGNTRNRIAAITSATGAEYSTFGTNIGTAFSSTVNVLYSSGSYLMVAVS